MKTFNERHALNLVHNKDQCTLIGLVNFRYLSA